MKLSTKLYLYECLRINIAITLLASSFIFERLFLPIIFSKSLCQVINRLNHSRMFIAKIAAECHHRDSFSKGLGRNLKRFKGGKILIKEFMTNKGWIFANDIGEIIELMVFGKSLYLGDIGCVSQEGRKLFLYFCFHAKSCGSHESM